MMISIIVPVFNTEKFLPCCIESIINQTYKDLEIILVDDGSTDKSGEICDKYALKDSRIKVIHKPNEGRSAARNTGLDAAKGKWIGLLDSDDWIEPGMYEKLLGAAEETAALLAYCGYNMCYNDGVKIATICTVGKQRDALEDYFSYAAFVPHVCALYHCSVLQDGPQVRYDENIDIAEDILFTVTVLLKQRDCVMAYVPEALYNYRKHRNELDFNFYSKNDPSLFLAFEQILLSVSHLNGIKTYALLFYFSMLYTYINGAAVHKTKAFITPYRKQLCRYAPKYIISRKINIKEKIKCLAYIMFPMLAARAR